MAWFNKSRRPTEIDKAHGGKKWMPFAPSSEIIDCFLCNEEVNWTQGVYWHGTIAIDRGLGKELKPESGYIFLHDKCAERLALHLAKDALLSQGRDILCERPNEPY